MQATFELAQIQELPDVEVDACCTDANGYLSFISIWGRDTATSELLARLTLPGHESDSLASGFTITVNSKEGVSRNKISVTPDLLEKHFSRSYGRTKFGSINNLWLYDRHAVVADKANLKALVMLQDTNRVITLDGLEQHPNFGICLQQLISLSPVPILQDWAPIAFKAACQLGMVSLHTSYLGRTQCVEIQLEQATFERKLSQLICDGTLAATA